MHILGARKMDESRRALVAPTGDDKSPQNLLSLNQAQIEHF